MKTYIVDTAGQDQPHRISVTPYDYELYEMQI